VFFTEDVVAFLVIVCMYYIELQTRIKKLKFTRVLKKNTVSLDWKRIQELYQ
jgi:hypothetical protein